MEDRHFKEAVCVTKDFLFDAPQVAILHMGLTSKQIEVVDHFMSEYLEKASPEWCFQTSYDNWLEELVANTLRSNLLHVREMEQIIEVHNKKMFKIRKNFLFYGLPASILLGILFGHLLKLLTKL